MKLKLSNTKQLQAEPMRVYLNKLDRIISISSLTDEAAINDLKIATVTINCNSAAMKRFILSKGDGITIKDILDESVLQEQVEKEFKLINQIQINQSLLLIQQLLSLFPPLVQRFSGFEQV